MYITKRTVFLCCLYLITLSYWIIETIITHHSKSILGFYFQIPLAGIPLSGALGGLLVANKWGGFNSKIGKAIIFLSLGTFFWGIGMVLWNYYIFFESKDIPYPSWSDAGYILSYPLSSLGVYYLSHVIGARFGLRRRFGKVKFLCVFLLTAAISYYLVFIIARQSTIDTTTGGLKTFFDFFYPIGSSSIAIFVLVTYTLSQQFLGGKYRNSILLLFTGYIFFYAADFSFSYSTTNNTYFNGHYTDLLFATGMFLISLAINSMVPDKK